MGEGLIKPLAGLRSKVIDEAVDGKAATPAPVAEATPVAAKPITAAEARANQAAREAKYAAEEKAAKGMPKPSLFERAKKLVGM